MIACELVQLIFRHISFFRNGSEQPDVHAYSRLNLALMQSAHILRNWTRLPFQRSLNTAEKSAPLNLFSFLIFYFFTYFY